VSTFQAIILLQFNNQPKLSLDSLKTATAIPDIELKRHLLSLCTPKAKILSKSSKGKVAKISHIFPRHNLISPLMCIMQGIDDTDEFTFNEEFNSKLKRIKINLVALKEVMHEEDSNGNAGNEGIPATVEEDRRHLVEAAVVRIMKARKRSDHNDLIAEVTKQISSRFNPAPQVCIPVVS
jgi:cullin 3